MKSLRRLLRITLLYLLITMVAAGAALAIVPYQADILVTENQTISRDMVGLSYSTNVTAFSDANFMLPSGLDTRILLGLTEQAHMLVEDRVMFAVPVPGSSSTTYQFSTDESVASSFNIISGASGNVTIDDAANIELGSADNYTITLDGWLDVDSGGDLLIKPKAMRIFNSGSGNVTAFHYASANSTSNIIVNGDDVTGIAATTEATHWEAVDDPPASPDDAVTMVSTVNTTAELDIYDLSSHDLPIGTMINSANVTFRFRSASANSAFARPLLFLSSDNTTGTEVQNTGNTWRTFTETLDRPGGGDWSLADIEELQLGMTLRGTTGDPGQLTQSYLSLSVLLPEGGVTATGLTDQVYVIGVNNHSRTTGALNFDSAQSENVVIANSSDFGSDNGTWLAWYQWDGAVTGGIISSEASGTANGSAKIDRTSGNKVRFGIEDGAGTLHFVLGDAAQSTGIWYMVVGTFGGSGMLLYEQTVLQADTDNFTGGTTSNPNSLYLGSARPTSGFADVFIEEIQFYDRVMGQAEITANFNSGLGQPFPEDDTGLILWLRNDDGKGLTTTDLSGFGNDGILDATVTWREGLIFSQLAIEIDTVEQDTGIGLRVNDTAFDYTLFAGDSMPYANDVSIEIGQVEQILYNPNLVIIGTELPDRAGDATDNDGTFNFGSLPAGITLVVGSLLPVTPGAVTALGESQPDVAPEITTPDNFILTLPEGQITGGVIAPIVNAFAALTPNIPVNYWWWMIYGVTTMALIAAGIRFLNHLWYTGIAVCVNTGLFVAMGVLDWWLMIPIVGGTIASVLLDRAQAPVG
ncbi:hypothetical protein LCGC14_0744940 [marine sediment metagenome]|uniref:LamG-like jellyroll fold domain-containing protein n=1 Tax=marine sediment metagenome TaxID=412755 RepID=A0A0F9SQS4_9ZZZZ